jgi:hypothetical protein
MEKVGPSSSFALAAGTKQFPGAASGWAKAEKRAAAAIMIAAKTAHSQIFMPGNILPIIIALQPIGTQTGFCLE